MYILLEAVIKISSYILLFLGISRIVRPLLMDYYRLRKRSYRIKKQSSSNLSNQFSKRTNVLHSHISLLVKTLSKKHDDGAVANFYILTVVIFAASFVVMSIILKMPLYALLVAVALAVMPYVWKRFQLAGKRMETAYAFMKEYHIFLQSYQQNKDVYHTLVDTVKSVQDKNLKFTLMKVLSSMQKDRNLASFKEAMNVFVYSINSSFSTRFANLLIKEYRDSVDISEALLDLHSDLQKREKDMAMLKSKRMETIFLGYMPLGILPILLFMGYQMSMMYETTQLFEDKGSVLMFLLAVIVALISAMSAYLLNKPSADI